MENNSRESVIERIKKLFALADNNPNQNEAIAAALKAQHLMAEHDVEECEIHGKEEQPIVEIETGPAPARWSCLLAAVIRSNFRCESYELTRKVRGFKKRKRIITFYGYQCDAQAAALTFNYLFKVGDHLARRYASSIRKEYGRADGTYNMFVSGFLEGVHIELEKQSQALMLVVPVAVSESFQTLSSDWEKGNNQLRLDGAFADRETYEIGKETGRKTIRARRIDEGKPSSTKEGCVA